MRRAQWVGKDRIRQPGRPHPPWPGREYTVAGVRVFVRRTPATSADAEPAVCIHGLGGSSQNWTDLADRLSDDLSIDAIDLPGFGHSAPSTSASIQHFADIVAGWIVRSGRGPVHLIGNSLGGAVAVYLAATRPRLVRTLTLISPAMPFRNPNRSRQSHIVPMLALPGLEIMAGKVFRSRSPDQIVREIVESTWARPDRMHAQRFQEAVAEARWRQMTPWTTAAYIHSFRSLMGVFFQTLVPKAATLWRLAEVITVPTLVIWGNKDRIIDVRQAPRTARAFRDGRLLILSDVGHVAQIEAPDVVARAIVPLLEPPRHLSPETETTRTGSGEKASSR
ncbi:alpha/beta fold hydrolase [Haloglycomyces albus]|uniref:alpha/beta fold hydrolase n=1 Tax=Haloglycomyces albus TaxID=526067 RepID=UPI00046CD7FE|nr:alpha/beta hydrolase [Haloglycomyces albus]